MDKYILNITFSVEKAAQEQWKAWLKNELLPMFKEEKGFSNPQIARVVPRDKGVEESFSVQHLVSHPNAFKHWNQTIAPAIEASLMKQFGQTVLFFPTVLELYNM